VFLPILRGGQAAFATVTTSAIARSLRRYVAHNLSRHFEIDQHRALTHRRVLLGDVEPSVNAVDDGV
jgi:hypothetical protein